MKAVLQRVTGACVHVNGKVVSSIGPGIVALIGIGTDDTSEEIVPLSNKILSLKMWNEGQKASAMSVPPQYRINDRDTASQAAAPPSSSSEQTPTADPAQEANGSTAESASRKEQVWGGKPWKSSVVELEGEILCISQFTLHARTVKGTKPDFHRSMGGAQARDIYDGLLKRLGENYRADRIKDGAFGEMMQVSLTNDGPVTLIVDTADKREK